MASVVIESQDLAFAGSSKWVSKAPTKTALRFWAQMIEYLGVALAEKGVFGIES